VPTPYIFAGLSVAVGFRCGLFNIGAEGQFFMGALAAALVGYSIDGLPAYIHLPLAILAGALAGAIWGAIPGFLKARFGAHEVVNTIMMNWIAFRLSDWLLNGPMKAGGFRPVTPNVAVTAEIPRFFPDPLRFNWGFVLALVMAVVVYWLLFKTTLGFEIRAVGANPDAAKYAGMSGPKFCPGDDDQCALAASGTVQVWGGSLARALGRYGFDDCPSTVGKEPSIRRSLSPCSSEYCEGCRCITVGAHTDPHHLGPTGYGDCFVAARRSSAGSIACGSAK
jgi:ABC-type uncharacterized transport system permease subunit